VGRTVLSGQIYLYAHLPLLTGLAALGAGIKLGIQATADTGLTDEVSWIIGVGIALFMVSVAAIHLVTSRARYDIDLWLRLGTAALALVLGAFGPDLGIVAMLAIIAGALAAQVVIELATHQSHRHGEGGIEIG
jgi:low temperature requirement protein LtrA